MKTSKVLGLLLFLVALGPTPFLRADVTIYASSGGYDMTLYWEADYDDNFLIYNADTNQLVASVTFYNNNGYGNAVSDSDDYYYPGVSISSYCDPSPGAVSGSATISGLPPGNYKVVSHESISDPYEYVTFY